MENNLGIDKYLTSVLSWGDYRGAKRDIVGLAYI